MNTRERFLAVMNFDKADRTLLWEFGYWKETLVRWYAEGLPRREGRPETRETGEGIRAEAAPHDHLVPPDVSFPNFAYYRERLREYIGG